MIVKLCMPYERELPDSEALEYDFQGMTWWWGGDGTSETAKGVLISPSERRRYVHIIEGDMPLNTKSVRARLFYLEDGYVCTDREVRHDR